MLYAESDSGGRKGEGSRDSANDERSGLTAGGAIRGRSTGRVDGPADSSEFGWRPARANRAGPSHTWSGPPHCPARPGLVKAVRSVPRRRRPARRVPIAAAPLGPSPSPPSRPGRRRTTLLRAPPRTGPVRRDGRIPRQPEPPAPPGGDRDPDPRPAANLPDRRHRRQQFQPRFAQPASGIAQAESERLAEAARSAGQPHVRHAAAPAPATSRPSITSPARSSTAAPLPDGPQTTFAQMWMP